MCNGPCAENWPALMAADDARPTADMTIVVRDDGRKMWAYKGKPLYTFTKDTAARRDQRRRLPERRMAYGDAVDVALALVRPVRVKAWRALCLAPHPDCFAIRPLPQKSGARLRGAASLFDLAPHLRGDGIPA